MKVAEVVEMHEALTELASKEMPFAVALQVATNIEKLGTTYKLAMEKRRKLIDDAIEKDVDGKPVKASDGAFKLKADNTLERDVVELYAEDVEIDGLVTVELEKVEKLEVKPELLLKVKGVI